MHPDATLLQMTGIHKSFPGVRALCGVDLTLRRGEVLALLGENGTGKSTLIKVLGGAHAPDSGTLVVDGVPTALATPVDAKSAGVAVIYQEFNLIPALTAAENIFLGQERTSAGLLRKGDERRMARQVFARIGVAIDPDARCSDLSVAQQQVVEIAKALSADAKIIVMDEPSATLTPQEVDRLFQIVRELRSQGIGVIYISHRLDKVFAIADRVMVLRDGQGVGALAIGDVTRGRLIELMVGRRIEQEFPKKSASIGPPRLVVRRLCRGSKVCDVSFEVRRGEVLGLTGLVGSGRTETARLIFGADRADFGSVTLDGRPVDLTGPRGAIRSGIALLSEDRKSQGLVLGLSVRENFGLPNLRELSTAGFVRSRKDRDLFGKFVQSRRIRITHHEQAATDLSGGNQQKVVLAKWLQRQCEMVLFDEPTRGIDVGSKYEIYLLMNELAAAGKAILMISSELPEVLGMSDRILVMHNGRITGEITDVGRATQEQIMRLAIG
jgi:ABC-type sugar transport system ATPase subunit